LGSLRGVLPGVVEEARATSGFHACVVRALRLISVTAPSLAVALVATMLMMSVFVAVASTWVPGELAKPSDRTTRVFVDCAILVTPPTPAFLLLAKKW